MPRSSRTEAAVLGRQTGSFARHTPFPLRTTPHMRLHSAVMSLPRTNRGGNLANACDFKETRSHRGEHADLRRNLLSVGHGDADHAVARDQPGKALLAPALRALGPHRQ